MDSDGTYQKGRRRITRPVTRVPAEAVPDPVLLAEVGHAVQVLDRDRIVLRRSTGWLIAGSIVTLLGIITFVGSLIFTRAHQFERLQKQVLQLEHDFELVKARNQSLERRLVEMETALENVKERR